MKRVGSARTGRTPRALRVVALVASTTLVLAGCTDDPETEPDDEGPPAEAFGAEPDVASMLPDDRDEPPSTLQVVDLVEGDGDEARSGGFVTVHYTGVRWADGATFDSSWEIDEPYVFELGAGRVIEGWEIGVGGSSDVGSMRVGGRRMLTIPPEQAYGDRGVGDQIAPGETLVFVIDLLDVEPME